MKTKSILFTTIFLLSFICSSIAQKRSGIEFGLTSSSIAFKFDNDFDVSRKTGLTVGFVREEYISKRFSIISGISYIQRSSSVSYLLDDEFSLIKVKEDFSFNYLTLPLKVSFEIKSFSVNIGGYFG